MFGKRKPLLRNFDQADWDGFAGATSPSATQPPMIGESGEYLITVDANGVEVWRSGVDKDDDHTWLLDLAWPLGRIVAEDIVRRGANDALLTELGFTEL